MNEAVEFVSVTENSSAWLNIFMMRAFCYLISVTEVLNMRTNSYFI